MRTSTTTKLARALFLVLLAFVVAACTSPKSDERVENEEVEHDKTPDRVTLGTEALEALQLTYATAEERELIPSLEIPAELVAVPDRHAKIGPLVAGRIVSVFVNIGDNVEIGAPLAAIDSPEVGRARAEYIAARARVDVATQTYDRERSLLKGRATSEREVQEAEAERKTAEANLQATRTLLATLGVNEGAPAQLSESARVVLTSPIAGVVVSRTALVGQSVEASETLIEVVDLDVIWLLGDVYERDMRLISAGQKVNAEVRAFPGEMFSGNVDHVAGTLDERTRSVKVRVVLQNAEHRLRPGMFATTRIQGTHEHEPRRMLAIPWSAVQVVDDHRAVFVRKSDGEFELRSVHTGERAGDDVEILNGLSAGDEVVATGSFLLKGQLLRSTLGEDE